jgi:hypothetical protein
MRLGGCFVCCCGALVAIASAQVLAQTASNQYATLSVVDETPVRIAPNANIDSPFRVRIVDAHGTPVRGIVVQFFNDICSAFDGMPNVCAPDELYGHFVASIDASHVLTDANGVAVAPPYVGGSAAAVYSVAACAFSSSLDPENAAIGDSLCVDAKLYQVALDAPVPITTAYTGAWYDPTQSGHGLILEVLSEHRLLAFWFTFDREGRQTWFGGVGNIDGDLAVLDVAAGAGGAWIPNFDPGTYYLSQWGTLMFQFRDCDHGRVDFTGNESNSFFGHGHMDLTRLTHPAGLACE